MKSMVVQKLGDKLVTNYFPANSTGALAFAEDVLDGELTVYKASDPVGSDAVDTSIAVSVMIRQDSDNKKTYLNFVIKATKTDKDVIDALKGKTINGIKADNVIITSFRFLTH